MEDRAESGSGGMRSWVAPVIGGLLVFLAYALPQTAVLGDVSWRYVSSAFNASHVWAFDHIARMVTGVEPLGVMTNAIGFPDPRDTRLVQWAPSIAAIPLRPLFGPMGAYNVIVLLVPVASFLATFAFLRRLTEESPWVCAGAAIPFVVSPYALGCLAAGQTEKLHLWIPPLLLLCIHGVVRGPRRWAWIPALAVSSLASGFSGPDTLAFLPFAAVGLVLYELWSARQRWWVTLLWGVVAAGALAAPVVPSLSYYRAPERSQTMPAFMPASRVADDRLQVPAPMAQPKETLLGTGYDDRAARGEAVRGPGGAPLIQRRIYHVTYVVLPLLLLAGILAWRPGPARGLAWILVLAGLTLAAGPYVTWDHDYLLREGRRLILPVWLLDRWGYPTAQSGMYYRAIYLTSLGLALALAGGVAWLPKRWRAAVVWTAVLVAGVDTWRASFPLWPLEVESVAGREALEAMRADPAPGAVLELPIRVLMSQSQDLMLAAVFHGRPTTALPQDRFAEDDPSVGRLMRSVEGALTAPDQEARVAALGALGFRYVVYRPENEYGQPSVDVQAALGPPTVSGGLRYWRLGPSHPGEE